VKVDNRIGHYAGAFRIRCHLTDAVEAYSGHLGDKMGTLSSSESHLERAPVLIGVCQGSSTEMARFEVGLKPVGRYEVETGLRRTHSFCDGCAMAQIRMRGKKRRHSRSALSEAVESSENAYFSDLPGESAGGNFRIAGKKISLAGLEVGQFVARGHLRRPAILATGKQHLICGVQRLRLLASLAEEGDRFSDHQPPWPGGNSGLAPCRNPDRTAASHTTNVRSSYWDRPCKAPPR
jgi:hypothetical protein